MFAADFRYVDFLDVVLADVDDAEPVPERVEIDPARIAQSVTPDFVNRTIDDGKRIAPRNGVIAVPGSIAQRIDPQDFPVGIRERHGIARRLIPARLTPGPVSDGNEQATGPVKREIVHVVLRTGLAQTEDFPLRSGEQSCPRIRGAIFIKDVLVMFQMPAVILRTEIRVTGFGEFRLDGVKASEPP